MLTFIMLARLASLCQSAVVQRLDRLVEPLRATCTTKVGPSWQDTSAMLSNKDKS